VNHHHHTYNVMEIDDKMQYVDRVMIARSDQDLPEGANTYLAFFFGHQ
jgi:hypothetical protein